MARLAYGDREFSEDTREAEPGDSGTEPGPGDTGDTSPGSPGARQSSAPSNTIRTLNTDNMVTKTRYGHGVRGTYLTSF